MALTIRPDRYQEIPNGPFGFKKVENEGESEDKEIREELAPGPSKKRVRARTEDGHFVKDDPSTPENEAWVEVKSEEPSTELEAEPESSKD